MTINIEEADFEESTKLSTLTLSVVLKFYSEKSSSRDMSLYLGLSW